MSDRYQVCLVRGSDSRGAYEIIDTKTQRVVVPLDDYRLSTAQAVAATLNEMDRRIMDLVAMVADALEE